MTLGRPFAAQPNSQWRLAEAHTASLPGSPRAAREVLACEACQHRRPAAMQVRRQQVCRVHEPAGEGRSCPYIAEHHCVGAQQHACRAQGWPGGPHGAAATEGRRPRASSMQPYNCTMTSSKQWMASPAGGKVPQAQLAALVDGAQQAVLHAAQLRQLAHALAAAAPKQATQHLRWCSGETPMCRPSWPSSQERGNSAQQTNSKNAVPSRLQACLAIFRRLMPRACASFLPRPGPASPW